MSDDDIIYTPESATPHLKHTVACATEVHAWMQDNPLTRASKTHGNLPPCPFLKQAAEHRVISYTLGLTLDAVRTDRANLPPVPAFTHVHMFPLPCDYSPDQLLQFAQKENETPMGTWLRVVDARTSDHAPTGYALIVIHNLQSLEHAASLLAAGTPYYRSRPDLTARSCHLRENARLAMQPTHPVPETTQ